MSKPVFENEVHILAFPLQLNRTAIRQQICCAFTVELLYLNRSAVRTPQNDQIQPVVLSRKPDRFTGLRFRFRTNPGTRTIYGLPIPL